MKQIVIISALILGYSLSSFSQDKAADLQRLFTLMNSEKMIDAIMNNMITVLKNQANDQFEGSDAKEKFNEYIEFVISEAKELSKKLVNEEMVQIYDNHFTHQEIKDLITFFESSTGKKMLEMTPEINKDLLNVMTEKYMPDFQNRLTKKLEELQ